MNETRPTTDFHHPPTSTDPDTLAQILDRQAASYLPDGTDRSLISRAYSRAAQAHQGIMRDSGEPYVTHPLHVALILSCLQLDLPTLAAALLHDVLEDTQVTYHDLQLEFGSEIADLVEGVTKLSQASKTSRDGQSAANLQKVYLAMSEDIRVIFIKLADRLHNLRTLDTRRNPLSRTRSATEALEVYARIADRLGIAILRKEMEDIAFSYLDPEEFVRVQSAIEERYHQNAHMLDRIHQEIPDVLGEQGVQMADPVIQPNPRRVYDMYRRMQQEDLDASLKENRIPPLLRFHVIVQDVASCYLAMQAIHSRWTPIVNETRDYIWAPLPNGYQSLHTTVTIDQHPIKFQIRTTWMHRTSQLGIIAYMQEGEWSAASPALKQTVEDLRRFGTEAAEELSNPIEFIDGLKREILSDEIYVYTPKDEVIGLPVGATPVDFAYRIHTDIGHSCRGALVDGHWAPLNRPLRTGERVQILTKANVGPRFDWLSKDLGYTQSALAKAKIRRWFRRQPDQAKIELGRQKVGRVLDRLAIEESKLSPPLAGLAKRLGYQDEQELFQAIGGCDRSMERVLPELLQASGDLYRPPACETETPDISVTGLGSMGGMDSPGREFAHCCRPQPGDDIVGYILSSLPGVEVHRSDCPTLLDKLEQDPARLIVVKWGRPCDTYPACMQIYAHDRPFLLRDVWNIIFEEGINVSGVDVQVNRARDATITACIDIEDWFQFHRVLTRIGDLPGTIRVRRQLPPAMRSNTSKTKRPPKNPPPKTQRRLRFPLFSWLVGG
jgi:GTP pyrophosphokinase